MALYQGWHFDVMSNMTFTFFLDRVRNLGATNKEVKVSLCSMTSPEGIHEQTATGAQGPS